MPGTKKKARSAMTLPEKQARPRGRPRDEELTAARREEILDVAGRVFAERGYPGTDVQVIADGVGVGKGTIYRYFPSKRELFLAAADRGMKLLQRAVDAAMQVPDPLDAIEAAIGAYLRHFRAHPELVELLIQERAEFRDRPKPTYFEHREANEARWRDFVAGLVQGGRVREIPFEQVSGVMGDLLYGTMFTNYFARRQIPVEEQVQQILEVVFNGILSSAEREGRAGRMPAADARVATGGVA
jgi:AcrR family transcriptional regulator